MSTHPTSTDRALARGLKLRRRPRRLSAASIEEINRMCDDGGIYFDYREHIHALAEHYNVSVQTLKNFFSGKTHRKSG